MKYLLGADVGTTSLKMVLFDEQGCTVKTVTKNYSLETQGDRVELDAEVYWRIFTEAYDEISSKYSVSALSIDTQCETLIITDESGNPLRKAIVWLDNRATKEAEEIERQFSAKTVYETTGQPEVTAAWPACKLLWLKRNEPEVFSQIHKIFLLADYLYFKLTGETVTEKTLQSSSLYLNIQSGNWWGEMLEFIGVAEDKLPRITDTTDTVGFYGETHVVMGVMDQIAGAVGAGVTGQGYISEMTGTAMVVLSPCETIPPYDPASLVPCHLHYNGKYCLMSWTPTAGMALQWYVDQFCEEISFNELDKMAADVDPGCNGLVFLPYQCGSFIPKYNPDARGVFAGLTLEHKRAHLYRAIMESIAYVLKSMLDYLNPDCTEIRAIGGGANSPLWCQIKSDVTGLRFVTLKHKETACLGSALIAGVGAGLYPDVKTACEKLIGSDVEYTPSGTDYTEHYQHFCELEKKHI